MEYAVKEFLGSRYRGKLIHLERSEDPEFIVAAPRLEKYLLEIETLTQGGVGVGRHPKRRLERFHHRVTYCYLMGGDIKEDFGSVLYKMVNLWDE